jgi:hypothetical protein
MGTRVHHWYIVKEDYGVFLKPFVVKRIEHKNKTLDFSLK